LVSDVRDDVAELLVLALERLDAEAAVVDAVVRETRTSAAGQRS
jgi:hypothetical protein